MRGGTAVRGQGGNVTGWRAVLTALPLYRLTALLLLASCSHDHRTPLTVYSPHGREQLSLLEKAFEKENPDIDVRWLYLGSQEVLDRLRFEKMNPQADVWFGGPTTIFDRGVADSLLQPYRPVWADAVDSEGRGPADLYWPVYRTPAVIAFNSAAIPESLAPHDWDEILLPQWRDQVLIREPMASGTMRAIWGLIVERSIHNTGDTTAGMAWLRKLDAQTRTYTLNPAILAQKLARREGLVTLWDLPDILIWQGQGMPFGYLFPKSGTVAIEDAIGLVRGAKHPDAARRYIDFVGSQEAQILTAREVFRLPARLDLPPDSVPPWVAKTYRDMKVAPVDWSLLARDGSAWMGYWDQHVRGTGR
ncbi:MAG: extracellular solute-binding protein [Gemmatimonadales bacterium]